MSGRHRAIALCGVPETPEPLLPRTSTYEGPVIEGCQVDVDALDRQGAIVGSGTALVTLADGRAVSERDVLIHFEYQVTVYSVAYDFRRTVFGCRMVFPMTGGPVTFLDSDTLSLCPRGSVLLTING